MYLYIYIILYYISTFSDIRVKNDALTVEIMDVTINHSLFNHSDILIYTSHQFLDQGV